MAVAGGQTQKPKKISQKKRLNYRVLQRHVENMGGLAEMAWGEQGKV